MAKYPTGKKKAFYPKGKKKQSKKEAGSKSLCIEFFTTSISPLCLWELLGR
jgi:hypothetical protein